MPAGAGAASTPGVECIRIDWEHREDEERGLMFLVNEDGSQWEGSTLTYFDSPAGSSVDFFDSSTGDSGIIWWYPDCSGSIQWPDYRDGEKYCWDSLHNDTVCPD